jgi:hypothetical protein
MPDKSQVIDVPGDTAIAVETIGAESMVIVAFKDDRAAGDLFREWLALPGTLVQFREWATSPKRQKEAP